MSNEQDIAVINDCLGGNTGAFEALVDKYQKVIFNLALQMVGEFNDARDITQTVFIRAFENLETYDPKYKFFSWIYKMTVNESINLLSRRKHEVALSDRTPSSVPPPDEEHAQNQLAEIVQEAVGELPIEYRVILVLRHFADLSYDELGFVLDLPEKTVKSRLFTARRRLAAILVKWGIKAHG